MSEQHSPISQHGCMHISFYKNDETLRSLQTLIAYSLRFRNRHHFLHDSTSTTTSTTATNIKHEQHPTLARMCLDKLPTPLCHKCGDACGQLHACLHCVFIGCHKHSHIKQHMSERSHLLSIDFYNYTIYCSKCNDYVYDWDFEDVLNVEKAGYLSYGLDPYQKTTQYTVWKPTQSESELLKEKSRVTGHLGLRGLRNLGNTCFMNVILQCLVHNPPLRAYFLSDKHNFNHCLVSDKLKCMGCQMDKLFSQFYSGQSTPILPSEFLWSMWSSCKELVGYAQQDAHEFFISVLNNLHSAFAPQILASTSDCCIVHSIFGGVFQSTVRCLRCGNCNTTNDPFVDISLDVRPVFSPIFSSANSPMESQFLSEKSPFLQPSNDSLTQPAEIVVSEKKEKSRTTVASIKTSNLSQNEVHTLSECLDIFTHEEKLKWTDYKCSKCEKDSSLNSSNALGSIKQLSLKKLPLVLVFQLKRYDHRSIIGLMGGLNAPPTIPGNSNDTGGKLNMIVKFPLDLDMSPWTTKHVQSTFGKDQNNDTRITFRLSRPNPSLEYSLFAVIVHMGTLQSGHYACYVRQSGSTGKWFRFDDHHVTIAEWEEVCKCEAYMLFYIKKTIEYE